jgi:hypothetical protein
MYSSEAALRLLPTPQLTRHPYPQHCYHVEREDFVCFRVS